MEWFHIFFTNITSPLAHPFFIWLQNLLWKLLGSQQRVILIIACSWKSPKITWPNESVWGGGGGRGAGQSSKRTFLLHSIPGLEFQLLIKEVFVCIVSNSNEFPGNITKMMLASLGCVFQERLLAAPFSCRLQLQKISPFLGYIIVAMSEWHK